MNAAIVLLAVIVVASGFIAYWADILGRKLGKKRLTLGRLRPRHTAALITAISGVLISITTIGLVMLLSNDVRDWIVRGDEAIAEARRNLGKLRETEKELQQARQEFGKQQNLLASAITQRDSLETQRKLLQGQVGTLKAEIPPLKAAQAAAERDAASAKKRYLAAQTQLASQKNELSAVRTQRAMAVRDWNFAVQEYNDAQKRALDLDRQIADIESKLDSAQRELQIRQEQIEDLNKDINALSSNLTATKEDLAEVIDEREKAARELERAKLELDGIRLKLDDAKRGLEGNLLNSRWKPQILPGGYELARIQLLPGQSAAEVAKALETALIQARKAAEDVGVKPRPGTPAASLKDQQTTDGKIATVEQQKAAVVKAATNLSEEAVIIASSFWNVFEGEDVPLIVTAYKNPLVYRQAQIVAETRIDGTKDDEAILKQLSDFISQKVRQKALADGMIPGAEGLGQIGFSELFSLARDIKDARRQVRLVAITKQDTRAADPLKLDLRLR